MGALPSANCHSKHQVHIPIKNNTREIPAKEPARLGLGGNQDSVARGFQPLNQLKTLKQIAQPDGLREPPSKVNRNCLFLGDPLGDPQHGVVFWFPLSGTHKKNTQIASNMSIHK